MFKEGGDEIVLGQSFYIDLPHAQIDDLTFRIAPKHRLEIEVMLVKGRDNIISFPSIAINRNSQPIRKVAELGGR